MSADITGCQVGPNNVLSVFLFLSQAPESYLFAETSFVGI